MLTAHDFTRMLHFDGPAPRSRLYEIRCKSASELARFLRRYRKPANAELPETVPATADAARALAAALSQQSRAHLDHTLPMDASQRLGFVIEAHNDVNGVALHDILSKLQEDWRLYSIEPSLPSADAANSAPP